MTAVDCCYRFVKKICNLSSKHSSQRGTEFLKGCRCTWNFAKTQLRDDMEGMQICSEMSQHLFARIVFYGRNKCIVWLLFSVFSMKKAFHGALTWLLVTCEIMSDWDSLLISHLTRHTQTRWYTDTYCRPLTSKVYGRVCVLFIYMLDAVVRLKTKILLSSQFSEKLVDKIYENDEKFYIFWWHEILVDLRKNICFCHKYLKKVYYKKATCETKEPFLWKKFCDLRFWPNCAKILFFAKTLEKCLTNSFRENMCKRGENTRGSLKLFTAFANYKLFSLNISRKLNEYGDFRENLRENNNDCGWFSRKRYFAKFR